MKSILLFLLSFLMVSTAVFSQGNGAVQTCFLNYKSGNGLTASLPERLTDTTKKRGDEAPEMNGYLIVYSDKQKTPFVNIKVKSVESTSFASDTLALLQSLRSLASQQPDTSAKSLMKLNYNGYTLSGAGRNPADSDNLMESFVMFPDETTIVRFDFFDLKVSHTNSSNSSDEYQSRRNSFLGGYTTHLNRCTKK